MCSFNLLEGGTIEPLSSTDKHDYNGHFLISTGVLEYEKQLYVSILEIGSKSMTRNTEMLTTFDNWIFLDALASLKPVVSPTVVLRLPR